MKKMFSRGWIMEIATLGIGIMAGVFTLPLVDKIIPASYKAKLNNYYGLINVVIGSFLALRMRNRVAKTVGTMVAAVGVYDLISQNIGQLGLPTLPRSNILIPSGAVVPSVSSAAPSTASEAVGLSYYGRADMGSNYELMGSDYTGKAMAAQGGFGSDDPYNGCGF